MAGPDHSTEPDDGFRPPRQDRAKATLTRILDATHHLLLTQPFDEVTVDDIVRGADSSVGSFYARFDDKEAALLALIDTQREHQAALAETFFAPEAWRGAPLAEVMNACVEMTCAIYASDQPPFRDAALLSLRDERFLRRRLDALRHVGARWIDLIADRADEMGRPGDPRRVARLTFEHVVAQLDWHLLYGNFLVEPAEKPDWCRTLTDGCLRILGIAEPGHVPPPLPAAPIPLPSDDDVAVRRAEPIQARGVESRDAFLDSLLDLLSTTAFDDVTVKAVADGADRSPGGFYSFFASKDDVLDALILREEDRWLTAVPPYFAADTWSRRNLLEAIETFARDTVEAYRGFGPLVRVAAVRATHDGAMGRHRVAQQRRIAAAFRGTALGWIGSAALPRPDEIYAHIVTVLDQELLFGPIIPSESRSNADLIADLTDACTALVGASDTAVEGS